MTTRRAALTSLFLGAALLYGSAFSQGAASTTALSPVPGTTCSVFPANNVWNTPIDNLPVNRSSAAWAASLPGKHLTLGIGPAGGKNYGFPSTAPLRRSGEPQARTPDGSQGPESVV